MNNRSENQAWVEGTPESLGFTPYDDPSFVVPPDEPMPQFTGPSDQNADPLPESVQAEEDAENA